MVKSKTRTTAQCLSSRAELQTVKLLQFRASRCEDMSDSCVEMMLSALRYKDTTTLWDLPPAAICYNND